VSPRRLALASLLACRPVGPVSPAPGVQPPDAIPATTRETHGGATDVATDVDDLPRGALDAATIVERVTAWDGPASLLPWRPYAGSWPDLPGRVVGVLWAVSLYNGRDECAARDANDRVEYHFSRGLHPSYALYFPSDGRGFNFLRQWVVPLPDGTTTQVDAAMFRADTANPWGLHACAHLVELDVNAGRGGRGLHFIATGVRVLDGTTAFPWQLSEVIGELRARFLARADEHRADRKFTSRPESASRPSGPETRRPEPGPWTEQRTPGMHLTWIPERDQLDVLLWSTESRTATRTVGRETVKSVPCPPGAPCMRREVGTFEEREFLRETVEFAVRFELDRTARVLRETIYAPRHQSTDGRDRIRVHD